MSAGGAAVAELTAELGAAELAAAELGAAELTVAELGATRAAGSTLIAAFAAGVLRTGSCLPHATAQAAQSASAAP